MKFGRTESSMAEVSGIANMSATDVSFNKGSTCYVSVTSNAENIYVNGTAVTSGENIAFTVTSGSTKAVQIITQNGTEAPFVTVLNISR